MTKNYSLKTRITALMLSIVMVLGMIPGGVVAEETSENGTISTPTGASVLTTDINEKIFAVGVPQEFTFTTIANGDAGVMVVGTSNFSDPDAIAKLEYYEQSNGQWYELEGDFGPATGFPMSDATSTFRVTFSKAGSYTFTAEMKNAETGETLCSVEATASVVEYKQSELKTNIDELEFVAGIPQEFTFSTIANSDAGVMVVGTSNFSDPDAIAKLEYYEQSNGQWYELEGDFGPASGFPMSDATSTFRVTFSKAGSYTFTAEMKNAETGETLCSVEATASVAEYQKSELKTNIGELEFVAGIPQEFTFSTIANHDAGILVIGTSNFSDPDAIAKLEYYEVRNGQWYELEGDFGPATGFPMSDATSTFRVTFAKAGSFTFTAQMKNAETGETMCSVEATASVAEYEKSELTTNIGELEFVAGIPQVFTFSTIANHDAGILVIGTSNFSDPDAIAKLEYYEQSNGQWYELEGDFGPATGFPMSDATSTFRVTFAKAGSYTFTAQMKNAETGETLCSVEATASVREYKGMELTTDIHEIDFIVGVPTEFKYATIANDDAGTMIIGTSDFNDPDAIAKLEYFDPDTQQWYELTGDFGPATGFPAADAETRFRVTFAKAGDYTFTTVIKAVESGKTLCSVTQQVTAEDPSSLTTDIHEKDFKVGEEMQFTFTTNANGHAGKLVVGTFEFSNPEAIEKLEYWDVQNQVWREFYGDFGPATGFPLTDATSRFKVTFKEFGSYTVTASMVTVEDREVLCTVTKDITVIKDSELTTNIHEQNFVVDQTTEFTFTTVPNSDAGKMVVGTFEFSDPEAIEKLEYWDVQNQVWREFYSDFGPATGFPMTNATSLFRVTFKKSGTYTVTASMVTVEGRDVLCTVTKTVTVSGMEQSELAFAQPEITVTYEPELTVENALVNIRSSGQITYRIVSGGDVIELDQNGTVTVVKSGTAVVEATVAADDQYLEAKAQYTIIIEKAAPAVTFEKNEVVLDYGTEDFTQTVSNSYPADNWVYSIVGENQIGAEIDPNTGKITFRESEGKVGTVTVKAFREANECYEALEGTYTLTVKYHEAPEHTFIEDKWYNGPVTIVAPNEFQISYSNGLTSAVWADYVSYETEGVTAVTVYLKHKSGYITDAIVIRDVKIDTVAPEKLLFGYESVEWITVAGKEYGLSKDTVKVFFEADGTGSNVHKMWYRLNDTDEFKEITAVDGVYAVEVPAGYRGSLTLRVQDQAGNTTEITDSKILVVDNTVPEISAVPNNITQELDSIIYSNSGECAITLTVTEANFDLREKDPVVMVNGVAQELTWSEAGEATLNLPEENDYIITVDFNDRLHDAVTCQMLVHVDRTAPVIDLDIDTDSKISEVDGRYYFDGEQTVTITIHEQNFRMEDVEIVVMADGVQHAYTEYAPDLNENDQTVKLMLKEDANYTVIVNYTDLAGNGAEQVSGMLTVDQKAPENLSIEYGTENWPDFWNKLFGFSNDTVEVTIYADDATAGIAYLEYSLDNGVTYTKVPVEHLTDGKYTFEIEAQYRNLVVLKATDWAGRTSILEEGKTLVVDAIAPNINAAFSGVHVEQNGILYTKDPEFAVIFTVSDANYDLRGENKPVVMVNGTQVENLEWVDHVVEGGISYGTATLPLPAEGDYEIAVTFHDYLHTAQTYTKKIHVDFTVPVIAPAVFGDAPVQENFYDGEQTVTYTITEHNFDCKDVVLEVIAKDVAGNDVEIIDYAAFAKNPGNWHHNGDERTLEVKFPENANYTVKLSCQDIPGNASEVYEHAFTVDKVKPQDLDVIYSKELEIFEDILSGLTFGFYKPNAEVTLVATDLTAGVEYFTLAVMQDGSAGATDLKLPKDLVIKADGSVVSGDKGFIGTIKAEKANGTVKLTFQVPAQFRGEFQFTATDLSHNTSDIYNDGKVVVVDTINPQMQISYAGPLKDRIEADGDPISRQPVSVVDAATRYVYSGAITATIKVIEANFYADDFKITVTRDGAVVTDWTATEWAQTLGTDEYTKVLTLAADGDYVVTVEYGDKSGNQMDWESKEYTDKTGTVKYQSNVLTVDTTKPVLNVTYDNNTFVNGKFYAADRTATITITDRNFRPNRLEKAEVVLTITAQDVNGKDVAYTYSKLTAWSDWKQDGDTWTAQIPFAVDANYAVTLTYTDIAGNKVESDYTADFTVDKVKPQDLNVLYSQEVKIFEDILSGLTFGFYQPKAEVTLVATDLTAGVEFFTLDVKQNGSEGATNLKLPKDLVIKADGSVVSGDKGFIGAITAKAENGTVKLTFEVPAQFRGEFQFTATDLSHNTSDLYNDTKIVVVDNIAPTRTVTYEPTHVVKLSDLTDVETFAEADQVILFYNKDAVASFTVNEANFYAEDVIISVNGSQVVPEQWTNTEGDTWTTSITLVEEGDYVITMTYPDRSGNEMVTYTSQRIVIDKTAPVVSVAYGNKNVQNTIGGRDYFDAAQTATVTIKEHNFRADDVVITVTAKDVVDAHVLQVNADGSVTAYANQGADRDSWSAYEAGTWRRTDDTFVLELTYSTDANYTFDIAYKDLAENAAADYEADAFTVDKTAPENLTVTYSTSVLHQILESVSFGFYNAEMTVTITATDDTSPIHSFVYGYISSEGVSDVNAQLLEQALGEAYISYNGSQATASFSIPKMVVGDDNQFNGTVRFDAYDRSGNSTRLSDDHRIVVDNISPTAKITYNAPVQENNGISFYAGDINGTIEIDEANFYASDVVVTVTRDGESYPVDVTWSDKSVDIHTGTFVLTEDGDYIVSVSYRDRSGNTMNDYVSNELTLDTTVPVVDVSNVVMNSANKDEVYGFTITVNDINLDIASLKPVLTAVIRGEDGLYHTQQIDLGQAQIVTEGQTVTYTVENLPQDALYTLTCTVQDMSGNVMDQLLLEDGQSYGAVQFSVNRSGSTFGFGSDATAELVDQYYVYSVDEDLVIVEVNVDPIEDYAVTLNGRKLTEGTEFTTTQTSNDGEWSIRTYTIKKDLFTAEGEYSVIVSSTDKTETTAFSDVKNLTVAFVVDQTAPAITITGLANDGRYQTEEQTVTLVPTDEGGRLRSLKVVLMTADGKEHSVRFEMSGEELLKYLDEHDGAVTFTIPDGLDHQVQILCDDYAVKQDASTNVYDETFTRVTVSPNQLVIFYADRPVFFGTVGGVLGLIALIIFLIKRNKKNKKTAKAGSLT